jgi:hypothetical protein
MKLNSVIKIKTDWTISGTYKIRRETAKAVLVVSICGAPLGFWFPKSALAAVPEMPATYQLATWVEAKNVFFT